MPDGNNSGFFLAPSNVPVRFSGDAHNITLIAQVDIGLDVAAGMAGVPHGMSWPLAMLGPNRRFEHQWHRPLGAAIVSGALNENVIRHFLTISLNGTVLFIYWHLCRANKNCQPESDNLTASSILPVLPARR